LLTISKHFSLLKAKTVLIIAFKKQERYFHIMLMKQNNMSSGRLQHFHFKYVYQKSQIIHKNHSKAIPWRPCRRKKKKKSTPPPPSLEQVYNQNPNNRRNLHFYYNNKQKYLEPSMPNRIPKGQTNSTLINKCLSTFPNPLLLLSRARTQRES
jgi:hypothetical protein